MEGVKHSGNRNYSVVCILLLLLISNMAALAQEQQIDEMVVSVRRENENVQDVPIQVTVFDSQIIQSEQLSTLADVAALTPSVQFDTGFWPSDSRVSIRGLFNRAGRPSAAVLIDGIDASSEALESSGGSALLNQRILDLERIEIARGPQSALFGRTAFSGAINYVTRRPPDEFEVTGYGEAASKGRQELRASVGGPVIEDQLAVSVLGSHYELNGDYTNPNNGDELGGGDSNGGAIALNWTPADNFSAFWNNTYSVDRFDPQAVVLVPADTLRVLLPDGTLIPNGQPNPINDPRTAGCTSPPLAGNDSCLWVTTGTIKADKSQIDISPDPVTGQNYPGTKDKTYRSSLIMDWDIGDSLAFRSATSYTHARQEIGFDSTQIYTIPGPGVSFGTNGGNGADARNKFNFRQYYQDFQLSGNATGEINWLAGLNAFWEDASDRNTSRFWYRDPTYFLCEPNVLVNKAAPCSYAEAVPFDKTIKRDTTSYSAFGLVGWQFADAWKLTLEARYVYDKIEVSGDTSDLAADALNFVPFDPDNSFIYAGSPGFSDSLDNTNLVPRISLDHFLTEQVMLYTSVAKGIKPPTYNTTDLNDPSIAAVGREKLWTYEVGAKSTLNDGTLLLNGAIYFNDYSDQQVRVQFPNPGAVVPRSGTVNAGEVTVWGAELDASWLPTDRWLLNLSLAFNDGEYDDLVLAEVQTSGAPLSRSELVKAGNLQGDFSGNTTPGTPELAGSLLGRYTAPLTADLDWYLQSVVTYQDERYADTANLVTLDSYWLVNAQAGIEREQWFVSLFVDNLFDDDTVRYAQEFIDQSQGFQGPNPANGAPTTFTFPVGYFAYLPQPRTVGIRFSYGTR